MHAAEQIRATVPMVIMMDETPQSKDQPSKDHWSTSEVARDLGVSPSLVRTWIAYMSWEVRRSAEGHRIFIDEDVQQLRNLKAWLDAGNSMKEFRRERQGEGPYDPRLELRNGVRRLRELASQEDAMIAKHREVLEGYLGARRELQDRLEGLRAELDHEPGQPAAAAPAGPVPPPALAAATSEVVQGVLKQLLSALLEKQGKLQVAGRHEEGGKAFIEYLAPGGRKQVVEDLCATEADRKLLDTVLSIILAGHA